MKQQNQSFRKSLTFRDGKSIEQIYKLGSLKSWHCWFFASSTPRVSRSVLLSSKLMSVSIRIVTPHNTVKLSRRFVLQWIHSMSKGLKWNKIRGGSVLLLRMCIGGHDLVVWHKAYSRRSMGDSNDVCSPWRLALELLQQRSKQKRMMNKEGD